MQLYAVDQVSISSVRSDSLRPGEKFTVSAALGEELLKKLPHAVSLRAPPPKAAPVSVAAVFDKLAADLATAQADADAKISAISASIVSAQADADAKIAAITATVVSAQADADAKIIGINASVDGTRDAANAEIKKIDDAVAAKKAEPAPLNKAEQAPKNKQDAP